ncbi:MAG: class I SAM-dependent methyltransferase, partial [Acidobacteriaceae bacterium]
VWDKIYKDFEQGGEGQSNITAPLRPEFLKFCEQSDFPKKSAFDIGFGTGKYLKYLQGLGFEIAGIDNSETALKMARELVGDNADLNVADMYEFEIPQGKYDFIYSLATIHHGRKSQVKQTIDKIYDALMPGGKVFVDFPNMESHSAWRTFQTAKEIEPGTFSPIDGPEIGLLHSVYNRQEIEQLFSKFNSPSITQTARQRWIVTAQK